MFDQFKKTIGFSAVLCSLVLLSHVSYGAGRGEQLANEYDDKGVSKMQCMQDWVRSQSNIDSNHGGIKTESLEETQKGSSGGVSAVNGENQEQQKKEYFLGFIHDFILGMGQVGGRMLN